MLTNTLTSFAILKVNIQNRSDYLEYLKPFIFQILLDNQQVSITTETISQDIRLTYGLDIPKRTVGIVLKRIAKSRLIKKEEGAYKVIGNLPDPKIHSKRANARDHIDSITDGLIIFSQDTPRPISDRDEAVQSICAFLSQFDVACLRSYLKETAIPKLKKHHPSGIVLVSDYIQYIQQNDLVRFNSFIIVVQGHMLANALLCPDLDKAAKTYRNVTFYFDTSLIIKSLGLDGESGKSATDELIKLIRNLKGNIAVFSHTFQEIKSVLLGKADHIDSGPDDGGIIHEARKAGTTRADLIHFATILDQKINDIGIQIKPSPSRINDFQIDVAEFEKALDKNKVLHRNPRAREYDIQSVQSIYAIRKNRHVSSLEKSYAVFVTDNSGYANTACHFDKGKDYRSLSEVSSVITDFSLANVSWLKAPMGASNLPMTQMLAISYAALKPSHELLEKYLEEIDKLQEKGGITERDHQLLRSSPLVYRELMHLTLGEDDILDEKIVSQKIIDNILERIYSQLRNEFKEEESQELFDSIKEHEKTKKVLASLQKNISETKDKIYWRCHTWASRLATFVTAIIFLLLLFGFFQSLGFDILDLPNSFSFVFILSTIIFTLYVIVKFFSKSNLMDMYWHIHKWCLNRLLNRQSKMTGLNFDDVDTMPKSKMNTKRLTS